MLSHIKKANEFIERAIEASAVNRTLVHDNIMSAIDCYYQLYTSIASDMSASGEHEQYSNTSVNEGLVEKKIKRLLDLAMYIRHNKSVDPYVKNLKNEIDLGVYSDDTTVQVPDKADNAVDNKIVGRDSRSTKGRESNNSNSNSGSNSSKSEPSDQSNSGTIDKDSRQPSVGNKDAQGASGSNSNEDNNDDELAKLERQIQKRKRDSESNALPQDETKPDANQSPKDETKPDAEQDNMIDEPMCLNDFKGQELVVEQIRYTINKFLKDRTDPDRGKIPDMLFTGGAGLGKTTLAKIVAHETGRAIRIEDCAVIKKNVALMRNVILEANKTAGSIVFLDEIHLLSDAVQSALYLAMHDGILSFVETQPDGRQITKSVVLKPMTIIGATTHAGRLNKALRERFERQYTLIEYIPENIAPIVVDVLKRNNKSIAYDLALSIAKLCRGVPRRARRYAKMIIEIVQEGTVVDDAIVDKWRQLYQIDSLGLLPSERAILHNIIVKFEGKPTSLDTLAKSIAEEAVTVRDEYEPYLIKLGLIAIQSGGRIPLKAAYKHLNIKPPSTIDKYAEDITPDAEDASTPADADSALVDANSTTDAENDSVPDADNASTTDAENDSVPDVDADSATGELDN